MQELPHLLQIIRLAQLGFDLNQGNPFFIAFIGVLRRIWSPYGFGRPFQQLARDLVGRIASI
jgi:hypothetical protein